MKAIYFFTILIFSSSTYMSAQDTEAELAYREDSPIIDLEGKWEMSINTPFGTKQTIFVINDDNTGVLSDNKIVIEQRGHSIKYKSSRYSWMGTMYMDNSAVIIADRMNGKSVITKGPMKGMESEWTAIRVVD